MAQSDQPVSGFDTRLAWLRDEMLRQLGTPGAQIPGTRTVVGWYMRYGFDLGIQRAHLEQALVDIPKLHAIALGLTDDEVSAGKPAPTFNVGDAVEVIVSAKNLTYHRGRVREVTWHHNEQQWLYLIEESGKRVGKRYVARDLRGIEV